MAKFRVTRDDGTSEIVEESGKWDACNLLRAKDRGLDQIDGSDCAAEVDKTNTAHAVDLIYLRDMRRYRVEWISQ